MKVVMLYEVAQDGLPKARIHYEAHRARLDEFHARGVLLMAGPSAKIDQCFVAIANGVAID